MNTYHRAELPLFIPLAACCPLTAARLALPAASDAAQTAGISSNALNVTRVGGLAALIASAGAAALAIFNVNKATDKASIVVAAYVSVGAIVAAGLLTAAIIISADIRARSVVNPTPTPSPATAKSATTDASAFTDAWYRALSMLHDALARLERTPVSPAPGWSDGVNAAWLAASASNGKTQNLHPADEQATQHARLSPGQASVISLFEKLAADDAPTQQKRTDAITRITSVLNAMDQSLPWP